jgi:hypothetical protein
MRNDTKGNLEQRRAKTCALKHLMIKELLTVWTIPVKI